VMQLPLAASGMLKGIEGRAARGRSCDRMTDGLVASLLPDQARLATRAHSIYLGLEQFPCSMQARPVQYFYRDIVQGIYIYICCHSCPSINAIGPAPLRGGLKNINRSTMLICIANAPSLLQKHSNCLGHKCVQGICQ
jgi:hypothetical protein